MNRYKLASKLFSQLPIVGSLGSLLSVVLIHSAALGEEPGARSLPSIQPSSADPAIPLLDPELPKAEDLVRDRSAYVDPTDYSLGATQRETEPALRSSTASPLPGLSQSPVTAIVPQKTWTDLPITNLPMGVAPVESHSVSISSSGIRWNAESVAAEPPASAIGEEYGTVKAFYNRTIRPFGRFGNGSFKLLFPLSIPAPITSLFGWRMHPLTGMARMHTGVDIGADLGTPVLAALTGRVIMANFFGGYGIAIGLEHGDGSQQTLYAHLSEIFVKPGEIVQQGAVIGRVGSTGASTGPHLHFEFRQRTEEGWVASDPGANLESAFTELVQSLNATHQDNNM